MQPGLIYQEEWPIIIGSDVNLISILYWSVKASTLRGY